MDGKIKNVNYRKFLDVGLIETITETHIREALKNIKGMRGRHIKEGRALLIAQYYTGARPNEILRLQAKDITQEGAYIRVFVRGSKKGLPRPIYLRKKLDLAMELYDYAIRSMPDMYLFFHYTNVYDRLTKKGKWRKEYDAKFRFHCLKWFTGVIEGSITPYYLRHNRFSRLALAGASVQEIRMLKGSRTDASVMPYLHLSSKTGKQLSRKID